MPNKRGTSELCIVSVPQPGLYFCAESAAEEEEVEYEWDGGIICG